MSKNKKKKQAVEYLIDRLTSTPYQSTGITISGHELTEEYLLNNGFTVPIMVESRLGLDLVVPDASITVQDILRYIGYDFVVPIINVHTQEECQMKFAEFVKYYSKPKRRICYNLLSLEISKTKLNELVQAPRIVRQLDWVNNVVVGEWTFKAAQKYCLVGTKSSYTDFHIDFGGSSVWYHVVKGEKEFYLIEPTQKHLSLFRLWYTYKLEERNCLADIVDACYKITVRAGNTVFLPSGWIHAVYTSEDSIVFGGNFLHYLNIEKQMSVYEIERFHETLEHYCYPGFKQLNWIAAERFPMYLQRLRESSIKAHRHVLQGAWILYKMLTEWREQIKRNTRNAAIPKHLDCDKMIDILNNLLAEVLKTVQYYNLTI